MDYTEICTDQEKLDPPASYVVFTADKSFTQDEEKKNNSKIHNKKGKAIEESKALFPVFPRHFLIKFSVIINLLI